MSRDVFGSLSASQKESGEEARFSSFGIGNLFFFLFLFFKRDRLSDLNCYILSLDFPESWRPLNDFCRQSISRTVGGVVKRAGKQEWGEEGGREEE